MKLVIFGLSVSSSWGNGHATLWRGLIDALGRQGHRVTFFERDVAYHAAQREVSDLAPSELVLYSTWEEIYPTAQRHLEEADVGMVTSYCPDGAAASELVLDSKVPVKVYYDLDTPVTLARVRTGEVVPYLPLRGLSEFDLVLSYTGGPALDELKTRLGARVAMPLYGCVDPRIHRPVSPVDTYRADFSYLGAYAADRQEMLERLFLGPARAHGARRFIVCGAQYPKEVKWPTNVQLVPHLAPDLHAYFYCSSPLTLSISRAPMAAMGWSPSARLFEAAACGVPVVSDAWSGISEFFEPGAEVLVVHTAQDALASLSISRASLARIGKAARERVMAEHTADHRAQELIEAVMASASGERATPMDKRANGVPLHVSSPISATL